MFVFFGNEKFVLCLIFVQLSPLTSRTDIRILWKLISSSFILRFPVSKLSWMFTNVYFHKSTIFRLLLQFKRFSWCVRSQVRPTLQIYNSCQLLIYCYHLNLSILFDFVGAIVFHKLYVHLLILESYFYSFPFSSMVSLNSSFWRNRR